VETSPRASNPGDQREHATVEDLLHEARARIPRWSPVEARRALTRGALLIDIRDEAQRAAGEVPGACFVPRNALEWRLDPSCAHRDRELARRGVPVIVMCEEGYQSSLAAAALRRFGLDAGDLIGGFHAWARAGLPVTPERAPLRRHFADRGLHKG
jgi:rhodanese-related sulfurtransferase